MIRGSLHRSVKFAGRLAILLGVVSLFPPPLLEAQAKHEKLPDGVDHYYIAPPPSNKSTAAQFLDSLYGAVLPAKAQQAFGKSVAFIVGVSDYHFFNPQLPSVKKDVEQMTDFFLNKAKFDEVYVVQGDSVTRDLIERYLLGVLKAKLSKSDRLVFYYSGHGGDDNGVGYILFSNFKKGEFFGPNLLPVKSVEAWSHQIPAGHILFILDSCASGLAITQKGGTEDQRAILIQTLNGNGSRIVLTAGTANESTYAIGERQKLGMSVFTQSLLNAFDTRSASAQAGFVTIGEVFAEAEKQVAGFSGEHGKSLHPQLYKIDELEYRGTFVFLNPNAKSGTLSKDQAGLFGKITGKGTDEESPPAFGMIEVTVGDVVGTLSVDGKEVGTLFPGESRSILHQNPGKHTVRFVSNQDEQKEVTVVSNGIAYATFGFKSPIDDSGKVPTGNVHFTGSRYTGTLFIDNVEIGTLKQQDSLIVKNLTVGNHAYRVVSADFVTKGQVIVRQNSTVSESLAPPTGLNAIVH